MTREGHDRSTDRGNFWRTIYTKVHVSALHRGTDENMGMGTITDNDVGADGYYPSVPMNWLGVLSAKHEQPIVLDVPA